MMHKHVLHHRTSLGTSSMVVTLALRDMLVCMLVELQNVVFGIHGIGSNYTGGQIYFVAICFSVFLIFRSIFFAYHPGQK